MSTHTSQDAARAEDMFHVKVVEFEPNGGIIQNKFEVPCDDKSVYLIAGRMNRHLGGRGGAATIVRNAFAKAKEHGGAIYAHGSINSGNAIRVQFRHLAALDDLR